MLNEARDNWTLIKLVEILQIFAQEETRLLPKLEDKFKQLLSNQLSKSIQLTVIKSILEIYASDSQIHNHAMKVLVQDFVESPDANLRLVGLTTLSSKVNAENGAVFCQRLLTKLKNEEINGIVACLVKMLRKLATKDNYQQVIGGLMQKDPDVVLDSLMDIETEL